MTRLPQRPRAASALRLSTAPKTLLAAGLALLAASAPANAQVTADYVTFHGANGGCAVDSQGYLYVFGLIEAVGPVYEPLVSAPGAPCTGGPLPDNGTRWLAKLDPVTGEFVWSRVLPSVMATGVAVAPDDGTVYVIGWGSSDVAAEFQTQGLYPDPPGSGRFGFVGSFDAETGCPEAYTAYASFVSGTWFPNGLTVDPLGDVHIVGKTSAFTADTDMVLEGYQPGPQDWHAFAVGFDATLTRREYFCYLPFGTAPDSAVDIVSDGTSVWVAGYTESADLPRVTGRVGPGGARDAFVLEFRPGASSVEYLTVIGGTSDEAERGNSGISQWQEGAWLDVDAAGNATVATWTTSSWSNAANVSVTPRTYGQGGNDDVLVTRLDALGQLDASGPSPGYLTLIGGRRDDIPAGLARNAATDRIYVCGGTKSGSFPTPNGLVTSHGSAPNKFDAFVIELDDATGELLTGTFLGGSDIDDADGGVVVGADGGVYVTGRRSADFQPSPADTPPSATTYELLHYAAKLRFGAPPPPMAGITITPSAGLETTEGGGTAQFTVQLDVAPTGDITLDITSDTPGEGLVSASGGAAAASVSLTFTVADWETAQTVTVVGQDDAVQDGDVAYLLVTSAAQSSDPAYDGLDPVDVGAVNIDDDAPPPAEVTVTGISSTSMSAGSTLPGFTVSGANFQQGAVITFVDGTGGPTPTAGPATLNASGQLVATVSASNGGPRGTRLWTVRVTNPDQSTDDYLEERFAVVK